MDFLPNGDLAICTWAGEVWIVEGAQGAPAAAKYRRFARGLAEPMGLAVRDGKIYVGTKQALYRLTDTDGNGEADLFECLNQSWGYTGSYNAFVYGPVFDKAGNFILANAGHSGRWDAKYMGWGLRISPDGQKLDTICSGFREPNGIGTFGPDRDVFVSENQGAWMAACKLNHVTPGKFYGHPSAWPAPQEEYGKHTRFDPPAVWFPYKLARSVTGFAEITDDRFGPFKGQLMVGDFQNAIVTRVQLEKVNGEYQGAVWPFLKQFQSGVNRLAYGPDGKLYVGGCQAPVSWKAVAPLDFALERISYTGKLPFEVKEVHALRDGFELTFTQPVEEKAAANADSYDVTQYGYKYHAKYGSPEFDHDGKENAATAIKIAGASVSPDKLKVRLKLEGWKTGYVTMVRSLDVKNAAGEGLVNDTFWYTLNQLPK
jgi:glucose/arabinose dehydrogenase